MICPHCGGKTKVKDSRPEKDRVCRLRQCGRCEALIPTIERVDLPRLRKREKGKGHG